MRQLLNSVQNPRAIGSLIFARIIYAINWVNLGAIFYLMGPNLGAGVSGLGTVTSAFYLGLGIMQIPGGLLAAKWGPKRVVVTGIFLSSVSVLATSVSISVTEVAILRFLVGWGMAFVFAPAVIIISRLLRGGKSGMGVGLMNSAFDVGGLFGLFVWAAVATFFGWRPSLVLSGGLGVLSGILVALFIPGDRADGGFGIETRSLWTVLGDEQLILLGFGTMGFGFAYTIVSGFMPFYETSALGVSPILGGLVASLFTVVPIFTAIWGGRLFDTVSRHRMLMLACLAGSALSMAVAAFPSIYGAVVASGLGGVVTGVGYAFAFAGAREMNRAGKEYESLAVAWVNSISLTGSIVPPIFFSFVVNNFGYENGWLWSGALSLLFLFPVLLMVERWRR